MKLLICTQVVDSQDSNLGFFHRWIEEFAEHAEKVTVICLKEGAHVLPQNVHVLSLGKEVGTSRITRLWRFMYYIYKYRNEYDAVFVHMNAEYAVLGSYVWHRYNKKIGLWYAHKSVTRMLKRAVIVVDQVFTVSPESFKVSTPKLRVVGHGIDTGLFKPEIHLESTQARLVTVGRIAASKHLLEMLQMLDVLYARGENFSFTIVGDATTPKETSYAKELQDEVASRPFRDNVFFAGATPHHRLPALLQGQDILLNFSGTGNMDKAGLEALAIGIPLLSTNDAFEALLAPYGLYVSSMHAERVADALEKFLRRSDRSGIAATLRNKVVSEHSLQKLIPKIILALT